MKKKSNTRTKTFKMRTLYISFFLLFITAISIAQKSKKDTLKTEEITVIKPYTPTVSDAFKVKSNPVINTANQFEKQKVNYSIFSIPVASTFTPSKGKAKEVTKIEKERLFDNYVLAGFGNYSTPILEAFLHSGQTRYNDFGAFIKYQSSFENLKDVELNSGYSDAKIDLYYKQFDRDFTWKVNAGYSRNSRNYYGLPSNLIFTEDVVNNIDEKQIYTTIYAGGTIDFDDSITKNAVLELVSFSDYYKTNEYHFLLKPTFTFPVSTELITTEFDVDYLSGEFKQSYLTDQPLKYNFLNLGVHPSYDLLLNDISISIGAKLYYSSDLENSTSKFKVYPNVIASYQVIEEILVVSAGAVGDLIQNTYKNFSEENPFISPTLNMQQTDQQYKAFIGAKGKLASNIGYNIYVNYSNEIDKPLYIHNQTQTNGSIDVDKGFKAGNSFKVIYDKIQTINFVGELNVDFSKEFKFSVGLDYANYTPTIEQEVWNLPEIKANISAEYKMKKWYAGTKLFFRGTTKDYVIEYGDLPENGAVITNKSYIDLNFNGGYIFSNRLSAFAKINNVIGESYQHYVNYPVQSIQFLAGVTYKFDLKQP